MNIIYENMPVRVNLTLTGFLYEFSHTLFISVLKLIKKSTPSKGRTLSI